MCLRSESHSAPRAILSPLYNGPKPILHTGCLLKDPTSNLGDTLCDKARFSKRVTLGPFFNKKILVTIQDLAKISGDRTKKPAF